MTIAASVVSTDRLIDRAMLPRPRNVNSLDRALPGSPATMINPIASPSCQAAQMDDAERQQRDDEKLRAPATMSERGRRRTWANWLKDKVAPMPSMKHSSWMRASQSSWSA